MCLCVKYRLFGKQGTICKSPFDHCLSSESEAAVVSCIYFVLLLRPSYPNPTAFTLPCCPLIYSLPCRNHGRPIMKKTAFSTHGSTTSIKTNSHISVFYDSNFSAIILFMVDLAGVEPASRTLFSLLHTAIKYIGNRILNRPHMDYTVDATTNPLLLC